MDSQFLAEVHGPGKESVTGEARLMCSCYVASAVSAKVVTALANRVLGPTWPSALARSRTTRPKWAIRETSPPGHAACRSPTSVLLNRDPRARRPSHWVHGGRSASACPLVSPSAALRADPGGPPGARRCAALLAGAVLAVAPDSSRRVEGEINPEIPVAWRLPRLSVRSPGISRRR